MLTQQSKAGQNIRSLGTGIISSSFLKTSRYKREREMSFSVNPKTDCPHVQSIASVLNFERRDPCGYCGNVGENWVCLMCSKVFCSRYVKMHMMQHNAETHHPLVLSFADLSFWCYSCNDYVAHPILMQIAMEASKSPPGPIDFTPSTDDLALQEIKDAAAHSGAQSDGAACAE